MPKKDLHIVEVKKSEMAHKQSKRQLTLADDYSIIQSVETEIIEKDSPGDRRKR